MTGRDLILYILQNNLESETIYDKDGLIPQNIGLVNSITVASMFKTSVESVRALVILGRLDGITFGEDLYIFQNSKFNKTLKEEK